MLLYPIGDSGQAIIFTAEVLEHFKKHQQSLPQQKEAGGQLFAKFDEKQIQIIKATGPRKKDSRGRTFYQPNRKLEQLEINSNYQLGLHYVGDWHTHPTPYPTPSSVDIKNINESVQRSKHQLNAFILVIVGIGNLPEGLYVSIADGIENVKLEVSNESQDNF